MVEQTGPDSAVGTRPRIDIEALNNFLESLGSLHPDLIFGLKPNQSVYHYTDLGGLHGILSKNDLWLTHARYSNDEEEMIHGYRAAEVVLTELLAQQDPDRTAYLTLLVDLLKKPTKEGVYICCFCLKDNLLSQWRGYGANGAGVSIQLNSWDFANVTGPDSPFQLQGGLMRLWKVNYDPARQQDIVRKAIDFAFKNLTHLSIQERAQRAADAIEFFVPTFKNADFAEEEECRLIFSPPQPCPVPLSFRVARGMLVPYYSLKELAKNQQWQLPITGLRIGPTAHKGPNQESAKLLLTLAGYNNLTVDLSDTPYRGG
jgi:Protein of unknown function (DUF2971)